MAVLDFILNGICLLLWLNWRSRGLGSLPNRPPAMALIGTLRRAGSTSRERWSSPIVLVAVLLLRAIIYWQVGPGLRWLPQLSFSGFVLHFRPDVLGRMLVFSLLGFLLFLGAFYFSLMLVVAVNSKEHDGWTDLARAHLGPFARTPSWLCVVLPFWISFLCWLAIAPMLAAIQVHLPIRTFSQLCGQAAVVGLGGWLLWKYILAVILFLHIVSSYVYLGNAPFWNFITRTAQNFLRPVAWLPLRLGRIDLAPILALALVICAGIFLPQLLTILYRRVSM
jgi:uncharacterized protein YggT (Ycf19 family)